MLDGDASLSAVSLYKVSPSDHHIIRYGLMQSHKLSKCLPHLRSNSPFRSNVQRRALDKQSAVNGLP